MNHHIWKPSRLSLRDSTGTRDFSDLAQVPEPFADRFRNLLAHEGVEYVGLVSYARENGGLPRSTGPWWSRSSASRGRVG